MSDPVNLAGVRAAVTGATSGLGAAMADALLEAGATVAMGAQAMALDVRDPASPERRIAGPLAPLGSERRNAGPIGAGCWRPRSLHMERQVSVNMVRPRSVTIVDAEWRSSPCAETRATKCGCLVWLPVSEEPTAG